MLRIEEPDAVRDPLRYVLRVSRNLLIDRQRHRRREAAVFGTADDIEQRAQDFIDPERTFAGKQELARALAAIDALPPRCRQAFKLHRFDGLSYAAIARRMAISTSMVEKHIAEALLKLNRSLRELGENGS
jgi:RNA polymerase sigma-70 factor (ECF subfamily)